MTERFMNYSCVIRKEVANGRDINEVAQLLGISTKSAMQLLREYHFTFNEYYALSLEQIVNRKRTIQNLQNNIKMKVKKIIENKKADLAEFAFSMPIGKAELQEFNAIKEKVFNDEYLPKGYRKRECNEIIRNRRRYL